MQKRSLLIALSMLSSSIAVTTSTPNALAAPNAPQVSLVNAGKATSTIHLAQSPTPAAAFAAAELQEHIRKITGATIPIAYDGQDNTPQSKRGARILVGESAATRQLGIKPAALKDQEHLIRFLSNTVVLLGKDQQQANFRPQTVAGKFGKAGNFDGAQRERILDDGFNDAAGTLEGWIWIADKTKDSVGTIFRLDGSEPRSYHIVQQESQSRSIAYHVHLSGIGGWSVTSAPLSPGWHFIQATHSEADNKIELFVDGVSQGTDQYKATTCRNRGMDVGGSPDSGPSGVGNAFQGLLDDLRVSNTVRAPHVPTRPLAKDENTTFLRSFDVALSPKINYATQPLPELYANKGTLDAAYEFLEKFCGVNWYLPGEIGTTFSKTKNLRVGGKEIRRAPAMKYREIVAEPLLLETNGAAFPERDTAVWKLRMRLGGERYAANHSFLGYYDRFLKDHPDWFASTDASQQPQLSYSNPEVVQQVVQDARDYFDGKGKKPGAQASGQYFGVVPMDADFWSAADKRLFDPEEANNPQFSNGKASPMVWGFVNEVAREVGKTNPDGYLSALAYSAYSYPPKNTVLEPNISVQMCLHVRNWWSPSIERNDRKILDAWVKQGKGKRPLYLWAYYCFPGLAGKSGNFTEFPGFFANTVVNQMRLYRKAGIRGIFMEHSSEFGRSFLLDQLEMYTTWKLADNPNLDGKQLINGFFRNYYGNTARPMQTMYEEMEKTYSDPQNYPPSVRDSPGGSHQSEELAWKYLGTPERMARWEALMLEANTLAETPGEKERLKLFEAGVWKPMQIAAARYRQTGPQLERIKAQPLLKIAIPVVADAAGDSSQVNWEQAFRTGPWSEMTGLPSNIDIDMKLAHDQKFLYVQLKDARHGNTLVSNPDIFSGDDWELFFAGARAKPYRQIAINPAGGTKTLHWTIEGGSSPWQSDVKLQSVVTAQGWTARLALPLNQLLPGGVQRGQSFFLNAYRSTPNTTALAWNPNFNPGFHDLSRMAEVTLD